MIFTIYFNQKYVHWAQLLIESINKFEPTSQIVAYAVNMTPKVIGNNIIVESVNITPIPGAEAAWQIIEHKISFLQNTIKLFPNHLHVMLDSDMLVVRPLTELRFEMVGMDVGGILVHDKKVAGGFISVNSTQLAEKFLEETSSRLLDGHYYYDKDQPILAEMYHKYISKGLKWFHADRLYLDHLEHESSYIWSAHKLEYGTKDKRFEKYRKYLQ